MILSAGAVQSPQLLQLSGIGPAELLREHGIPVARRPAGRRREPAGPLPGAHDRPHEGRNSLNDDVRNPFRLAHMGWEWLAHGRGPLTVGAGQVGGAACTQYASNGRAGHPVQRHAALGRQAGRPAASLLGLHRLGLAVPSAVARPHHDLPAPIRCRRRASSRATCRPNVDRKVAVAGIRMLREIYRQPAFRGLWDEEVAARRRPRRPISSSWSSRAPMAVRCSTPPAPAAWEATTWLSSIRGCACTASSACA